MSIINPLVIIYTTTDYKTAAWIGYYRILSVYLTKFMNFFYVLMYGNNGTFYEDTKYTKNCHKALV